VNQSHFHYYTFVLVVMQVAFGDLFSTVEWSIVVVNNFQKKEEHE